MKDFFYITRFLSYIIGIASLVTFVDSDCQGRNTLLVFFFIGILPSLLTIFIRMKQNKEERKKNIESIERESKIERKILPGRFYIFVVERTIEGIFGKVELTEEDHDAYYIASPVMGLIVWSSIFLLFLIILQPDICS